MEKLLLVTALACLPGDRLVDLTNKIPRDIRSMDFIVSLEPFYARFYIYQPGFQTASNNAAAASRQAFCEYPSLMAGSASDRASPK